jgi:hypothetical protein
VGEATLAVVLGGTGGKVCGMLFGERHEAAAGIRERRELEVHHDPSSRSASTVEARLLLTQRNTMSYR